MKILKNTRGPSLNPLALMGPLLRYAYFECPLLEAGKQAVAFFWYQVSSKIPRSINTPGP